MNECYVCRFHAGANFCAHCGRPTQKGAALESEEVLAEVEVYVELGEVAMFQAMLKHGYKAELSAWTTQSLGDTRQAATVRILAVKEET